MTVDEIIELLGRAAMCARLPVSDGAIANAKKRGVFPAKWMFIILNMAFEKGLSVPLSIFGCDPDENCDGVCVSSCTLDASMICDLQENEVSDA